MFRSFLSVLLVAFVAALLVSPLQAKDYRFQLPMSGSVEGVSLKEGTYVVKLEGGGNPHLTARIVRNGKILAETEVNVRERDGEQANTVLQDADGNLREIRLKRQVIIFR